MPNNEDLIMDTPDMELSESGIDLKEVTEKKNQDAEEQSAELSSFGARLKNLYEEYKDSRSEIEDEWIKDLRQYSGKYEPDVLAKLEAQGNRSKVYVGLTRTKVMAAYSRVIDLIFQPGEPFFSIEPTPNPDIDPLRQARMLNQAVAEIMQVSGAEDISEVEDLVQQRSMELQKEIRDNAKDIARESAKLMSLEIEDFLIENNTDERMKDAILEMCLFGSGAMKVGTFKVEKQTHWRRGAEGYSMIMEEDIVPEVDSVSIFDLYPDPYATSMDNADGIFRRHILTRKQFGELKNVAGFDKEKLNVLLEKHTDGNHDEAQHEKDRRSISGVNEYAESTRFEVLEYWGCVSGHDLSESGVDLGKDAELSDEYQANVWICDHHVLKAQINPIMGGYKSPYLIVPYERNPHQFWGVGVARMMRDSQQTMNAAVRIYLDNTAISSAPMVEVNTDLLAAGEDPTDLHPWRIFLREGGDAQFPMVRFYQPSNNASSLNNIIELFRRFADETTSLPSYTHGDQQKSLNQTATGMSMLMGAANVALKSTIKNLDEYMVKPMIQSLYHHFMEWSTNEDAKGDLNIVARGSTALIQKEVQSQRLLQFLSLVSNPLDASMVDRGVLLRDIAQSLDIDAEKVIKSDDELQEEQKQLLQQALAESGGSSPSVGDSTNIPGGVEPLQLPLGNIKGSS